MSLINMSTILPDGSSIVVLPNKSEDEFYNHNGGTSEEEWHRVYDYGTTCNNKELDGIISYYHLGSSSKFYVTKNGFIKATHGYKVYMTHQEESGYVYKSYKKKSCLLVQPVKEDNNIVLYIRIL